LKKFLPLAFLAFMALVIFWADTNTMPLLRAPHLYFPFGDKIGHFVIYGIFAYLLTWAMPFRRVSLGVSRCRWALSLRSLCHAGRSQPAVRRPPHPGPARPAERLPRHLCFTWIPCMRDKSPSPERSAER
jgi:hypothetical protein